MFSNGTEFQSWANAWCGSCKVDYDTCPVLDSLLLEGSSDRLGKGPVWSMETVVYCMDYERDTGRSV